MKRILALLTAVFLLLCLAACGQPADLSLIHISEPTRPY